MKLCTLQPTGDWLFCKRLPVSAYRAGLYSRLGACQEWCWRTHVACLRQDWGVGRSLPPLVIVCGPPASGKSTIADNLARSLGLPVLSKDLVKERMMDHLGGSEEIGAAAFAVQFAIARELLRSGNGWCSRAPSCAASPRSPSSPAT